MRRMLTNLVAAAAMLVPLSALAGNQEIADAIATHLRQSGRLSHYKIAVKFSDGTASLQGQVSDAEQARVAMKLAFEVAGVTGVVNNMAVTPIQPADPAAPKATVAVAPMPATSPAAAAQQADTAASEAAAQTEKKSDDSSTGSRHWMSSLAALNPLRGLSLVDHDKPLADDADQQTPNNATQASAQRVPASFMAAGVQRTAATEPASDGVARPMPKQAAPQSYAVVPLPTTVAKGNQQPMAVAMLQPAPAPEQAGATPPPPPAGVSTMPAASGVAGAPLPMVTPGVGGAQAPTRYDVPNLPNYAWPSYAAYPNYAAVTYPRQYSPTAWPYIGPFYPYPQVPLGWRKVTLQWDDGWWMLDFKDEPGCCWWR
jgi:hypothetical protein